MISYEQWFEDSLISTTFPFVILSVTLLKSLPIVVLFLSGLFWPFNNLCQLLEGQMQVHFSHTINRVCHSDQQSRLFAPISFSLPLYSAVRVPWCVSNRWRGPSRHSLIITANSWSILPHKALCVFQCASACASDINKKAKLKDLSCADYESVHCVCVCACVC